MTVALDTARYRQGVFDRFEQFGHEAPQFGERRGRRHAKHARIPQIAACNVGLRRRQVGLLNETAHVVTISLDVSIAGFRALRMNAERGDASGLRQLDRRFHSLTKGRDIGDQVVGGQKQQYRVRTVGLADRESRCGDRGGRIAPLGLQDKTQRNPGFAGFAVFIGRFEKQIPIGHRQNFGHARQTDRAQEGLLQQTQPVRQTDEGLGMLFARHRPQTGAGAAGQNYGDESHR